MPLLRSERGYCLRIGLGFFAQNDSEGDAATVISVETGTHPAPGCPSPHQVWGRLYGHDGRGPWGRREWREPRFPASPLVLI